VTEHGPASAKSARPGVAGTFPRRRLFRLLHRPSPAITWITGPPGSGKTTLVAGYLADRRRRAVWYRVDAGDGDVAAFFHYLGQAVARESRRARPLPALRPEHWADLSAFTRRFFLALFERLGDRTVLVLDDYQEAPGDCRLHDVLAEGLSLLPPRRRVVVISRTAAAEAFAPLAARGLVRRIDWNALRLTPGEARGIARARGTRVGTRVLAELHARCDGWAAGLVLMLDGAGKGAGPPAGARSAVFGYLAAQALGTTDAITREFLLETACLPWMTAGMATELTGVATAERLLHRLSADHFFTERRSGPEAVYQYHPLFREFLLARAAAELAPGALDDVRRRAARLMADRSGGEDAARMLRDVGDWPALAALIARWAPTLLAQGRRQTLEQWIAEVPEALVERDPHLQYWLGTSRTPFAPALGRVHLERAFEGFLATDERAGALAAWSGAVGAILYEWGDVTVLDRWIDWLEADLRAHRAFPTPALETRVVSTLFYALMFRRPEHPEILAWAERAMALSRNADVDRRLNTGFLLTMYWLWMGEHARAAITVDLVRDLARSPDASPLAALTCHTIEAYYHWHVAEPERCRQAAASGLAVARASNLHVVDAHLLAQDVYGALIAGDRRGARERLRELGTLVEGRGGLHEGQYRFLAAWEAHLSGDLSRALEHVRPALRLPVEAGMPFPQAWTHLGAAQILHDLGDHAEAGAHLRRGEALGRELRSPLVVYMHRLVTAAFAVDAGDDDRARDALAAAFAIGRRHGLLTFSWFRPDVMARLCGLALEHGIETDHARALVRRHGLVPEVPETAPESWPWAVAIRCLGGFELARDGAPVRFTGKVQQRPLALLKAIIALGPRGVAEATVGDALWPDAAGDAGHQALATTLHRLRALIGHETSVRLSEGRLALDPRSVWLDVWAFERLLAGAEDAERRARADAAAALTERALALYRGPFLPGESAAPWAASARERLRSKFLRATGRLGRHWIGRRDAKRALDCYERGLEVDDLAEEFYQGLMRCYLDLGRRGEGVRTYARCREILAARLRVAPSPETEALHRALRAP
jgi:ATP/maltotriose-dependent transcriptional regulator MalT/DNA-binding SARP family transcriptional activator